MEDVFAEIEHIFSSSGLPNPPVPVELKDKLVVLNPGVFGTRSDTPGSTQIEWFIDEFLEGKVQEDYLIFGHEGHGINSYAIGYQLVYGPLALFLKVPFGGVYMQNLAIASDLSYHFAQIENLTSLLSRAIQEERLQPGERFIVILDKTNQWRWVHVQAIGENSAMNWQSDSTSLGVLIEAVLEAHRLFGKNV